MHNINQFLTISEAARLLKVSKTSLRRWTNDGRLRCYRVGYRGERRFLQDDLLTLVLDSEDHRIGALPETGRDTQGRSTGKEIETQAPCHLCTMFRDQDEQWLKIRSYVLAHLQPGTRTVYVYHGERPDVLDRLREEGLDHDELIEEGRLRIFPCSDTYLLGGYFDAARMLDLCVQTIDQTASGGFRKLLLTGEMEWCTSGLPGCGQLIRYEKALDERLQNYPWVTTICQYSLVNIPATIIFDNVCLHNYVQLSDRLVAGLDRRART